jgi:hypothetical protein
LALESWESQCAVTCIFLSIQSCFLLLINLFLLFILDTLFFYYYCFSLLNSFCFFAIIFSLLLYWYVNVYILCSLKAGYQVTVYNRSLEKTKPLQELGISPFLSLFRSPRSSIPLYNVCLLNCFFHVSSALLFLNLFC